VVKGDAGVECFLPPRALREIFGLLVLDVVDVKEPPGFWANAGPLVTSAIRHRTRYSTTVRRYPTRTATRCIALPPYPCGFQFPAI
jgi:hypothetical protein